mgnify:CR=1 FL=1
MSLPSSDETRINNVVVEILKKHVNSTNQLNSKTFYNAVETAFSSAPPREAFYAGMRTTMILLSKPEDRAALLR